MLGLTAHFPYLADLAEFRRQAEWKFLHYGNQLRQQGSVGGQSLAEEAERHDLLEAESPRALRRRRPEGRRLLLRRQRHAPPHPGLPRPRRLRQQYAGAAAAEARRDLGLANRNRVLYSTIGSQVREWGDARYVAR